MALSFHPAASLPLSPTANQVLPGLLASGSLGAADLARCAATCSSLARIVTRDPSSDAPVSYTHLTLPTKA